METEPSEVASARQGDPTSGLSQPASPRLEVGVAIPALEISAVPTGPMKVMALVLRDPNPIHFDTESLRRLDLPERPINQGPNNVGYVLNSLTAWAGDPGAVEAFHVRFLANVLAGDRVVTGGQVTEISGDGQDQVVTCSVWLDRGPGHDQDRVLEGTARVRLRGARG